MTYVLLHSDGLCLGLTPNGRIDLVHPSKATHYSLDSAVKSQKHFGRDLDIVPSSWLGNAAPNPADAAELDALPRHGKGIR